MVRVEAKVAMLRGTCQRIEGARMPGWLVEYAQHEGEGMAYIVPASGVVVTAGTRRRGSTAMVRHTGRNQRRSARYAAGGGGQRRAG